MVRDRPDRRLRVEELADVANPDHADHGSNRRLEDPESEALETEDQKGADSGQDRGGEEVDPEQQMEPRRKIRVQPRVIAEVAKS